MIGSDLDPQIPYNSSPSSMLGTVKKNKPTSFSVQPREFKRTDKHRHNSGHTTCRVSCRDRPYHCVQSRVTYIVKLYVVYNPRGRPHQKCLKRPAFHCISTPDLDTSALGHLRFRVPIIDLRRHPVSTCHFFRGSIKSLSIACLIPGFFRQDSFSTSGSSS